MEKVTQTPLAQLPKLPSALYSRLAHLFIELRGRGVSLSALDLETLLSWQQQGIDPEFIATVMCEMANEMVEEGTHFPNSLAPVARRLRRELRRKT